jgi:glycosyltransferase involved in cell wall biosynthesis
VPGDDEGALSRALAAALTDDEERRRRGRHARRVANERYSWPAIAGRLATVFDEVADVADGRLAAPGTAA